MVLEVGKAEVIRNFENRSGASKVAIFGLGPMLRLARRAAEQMAGGIRRGGHQSALLQTARSRRP